MRKNLSEQKTYSRRFIEKPANNLRAEGADTTKKSSFITGKKEAYCVLYRIEDREEYATSSIAKEMPKIYQPFLQLRTVMGDSSAQANERKIAESIVDLMQEPYEKEFMQDEEHPGVVYSPGDNHKLEYNLAWVCGVAQANKPALLLSMPSRKRFMRRDDSGELSAFAYELGTLFRVGYQPSVNSDGYVYMKPPSASKVYSKKKAIVPNLKDMLSVLDSLHRIMFPDMVTLGQKIANVLNAIMKSSDVEDLTKNKAKMPNLIKTLGNSVTSPNKVGKFKIATPEEYQDMMLSTLINSIVNTVDAGVKNSITSLKRNDGAPRDELYQLDDIEKGIASLTGKLYRQRTNEIHNTQRDQSVNVSSSKKRKSSSSSESNSGSPSLFAVSEKKTKKARIMTTPPQPPKPRISKKSTLFTTRTKQFKQKKKSNISKRTTTFQ